MMHVEMYFTSLPGRHVSEEEGDIMLVLLPHLFQRLNGQGPLGSSPTGAAIASAVVGSLGFEALTHQRLVELLARMAADVCSGEEGHPSLRAVCMLWIQLLAEEAARIALPQLPVRIPFPEGEAMVAALESYGVFTAGGPVAAPPLTATQSHLFSILTRSGLSAAAFKVAGNARGDPLGTTLRRMSAVAIAVDHGTRGKGWPREAQEWLASAADGVLVRAWSRLIAPQGELDQALAGVQKTLNVFDNSFAAAS